MKKQSKQRFTFRLEKKLYAALKDSAQRNNRSLNAHIEFVLKTAATTYA